MSSSASFKPDLNALMGKCLKYLLLYHVNKPKIPRNTDLFELIKTTLENARTLPKKDRRVKSTTMRRIKTTAIAARILKTSLQRRKQPFPPKTQNCLSKQNSASWNLWLQLCSVSQGFSNYEACVDFYISLLLLYCQRFHEKGLGKTNAEGFRISFAI